ncbi:MAG: hypothetical protein KDD62_06900 [Bdellovibrionales bacterium]|nr:hypothetical protein [Bdellovibrionales bacterium]
MTGISILCVLIVIGVLLYLVYAVRFLEPRSKQKFADFCELLGAKAIATGRGVVMVGEVSIEFGRSRDIGTYIGGYPRPCFDYEIAISDSDLPNFRMDRVTRFPLFEKLFEALLKRRKGSFDFHPPYSINQYEFPWAEQAFASPDSHKTIAQLYSLGVSKVEVRDGKLIALLPWFLTAREFKRPEVFAARLKQIFPPVLSVLEIIKSYQSIDKKLGRVPARRFDSFLKVGLVLSLIVFFICAYFGNTLAPIRLALGFTIAVMAAIMIFVAFFVMRRKETPPRMLAMLVVSLGAAYLYALSLTLVVNRFLDFSEPLRFERQVRSKRLHKGASHTYKISVDSVFGTEALTIDKALYGRLSEVDTVVVYVGQGRLGMPWFVGVAHAVREH